VVLPVYAKVRFREEIRTSRRWGRALLYGGIWNAEIWNGTGCRHELEEGPPSLRWGGVRIRKGEEMKRGEGQGDDLCGVPNGLGTVPKGHLIGSTIYHVCDIITSTATL
jgi:hypothetical protein